MERGVGEEGHRKRSGVVGEKECGRGVREKSGDGKSDGRQRRGRR